jgi:AraC family transcriptional regulator
MIALSLPEPVITEKITLKLTGMVYYGNPVHSYEGWDVQNEIGKLWTRFTEVCLLNEEFIKKYTTEPNIAYEAHIAYPDQPDQEYHIFVGIRTEGPISTPIELFYKEMPATKYAIFTGRGTDMPAQMEKIYTEWLPNSPYIESYPMLIERYDQTRFKGLNDPDSEIDFMVPIKEKEDEG